MPDRFVVRLTKDHHSFLDTLTTRRRCSPGTLVRALVLQKADAARTGQPQRDADIARALHTSLSTVYRVRKRFVEHGLNAALYPKQSHTSSSGSSVHAT
jgi:hypothetical protein